MQLKKIHNTEELQVYSIKNPTERIKKMFPKKYIIGVNSHGLTHFLNVNTFPSYMAYGSCTGYIFTYDNDIPKIIKTASKKKRKRESQIEIIGSTLPVCLDKHFNKVYSKIDDEIDLVISCSSKNSIMPISFTQEIIIRTNSMKLFGFESKETLIKELSLKDKIDMSKKIVKTVNDNLSDIDSIETWIYEIITNVPLNCEGLTMKYPNSITTKDLKKKCVSKDKLFIGYDFRPRCENFNKVYEYENLIITSIEDMFEKKTMKLSIKDNFNGLLEKMKKELDEKKIKYTNKKDEIVISLENLRKLDLEYEITDFL